MKGMRVFCLLMAISMLLCACGAGTKPEEIQSSYAEEIARLEAGDYAGARSLIDIMEGREAAAETQSPETEPPEPAVQTETTPAPVEPDSVVIADLEVVELNQYNARDYFTFEEEFFISTKSGCTQYITLKEEYRDRLIAVEDVKLQVSYLLCEAHGEVDLEAEKFRSEYYEPLSRDVVSLEVDSNGMAWISRMLYFTKKGYFPDYAKDVEITSASGKLLLAAE